jgi:hypothetical protein
MVTGLLMTFSNIPVRIALDQQTKLVAHEGAHVVEILDTNKTLKQRIGEPGVYPNPAAGSDAYESTNSKRFEQLVGNELRSGVIVIEKIRDASDLIKAAPGVRK